MNRSAEVLVEVIFKNKTFIPSLYMEEAVLQAVRRFPGKIVYQRTEIPTSEGKKRFLDLSCKLYGEIGVWKHHRVAPIPSLFIDGCLAFTTIPCRDDLEAALLEALDQR